MSFWQCRPYVWIALVLIAALALPLLAAPRVPSVGEWAGIRAMKFLKCRYYRYDRTGRDVCEGDSIEDLRKAISDMSDTFRRLPRRLAASGSVFALTWGFATRHMGIPGRGHGKAAVGLFW
eukprot:CAMPEP_0202829012 /NCGR_PEP_ID=MMETSP1389-20130828/15254_1 /ASSEMBLY_ACC=CAM_ASM_000865 /TAXON_ID=302021 /ORGANISM="Rhodomonas sp., Strain CCMP768" /LENGTH=120 /DNA_ID=CAMNT_0049502541 /DNA_START=10 /DNA_END=369 /DNA_ORIENTATION=+